MTNEQIKLNEAFASACAKKSAEFIWSGDAFGELADTSQSDYARYFGNYTAVNSIVFLCNAAGNVPFGTFRNSTRKLSKNRRALPPRVKSFAGIAK